MQEGESVGFRGKLEKQAARKAAENRLLFAKSYRAADSLPSQNTTNLHAAHHNDTAQPAAAVVIDINILLPNTTMVKFRTAGCLLALSALSTARYYHGTTSAVGPAAINHTTMRILV